MLLCRIWGVSPFRSDYSTYIQVIYNLLQAILMIPASQYGVPVKILNKIKLCLDNDPTKRPSFQDFQNMRSETPRVMKRQSSNKSYDGAREDVETFVNDKLLCQLSKHIGNPSSRLADSLDVTRPEFLQIQYNHKHDAQEIVYQILLKWKQKHYRFHTVYELSRILDSENETTALEYLKTLYEFM